MPNQNHNSQHHPFKKFLLGTPDDDLLNGLPVMNSLGRSI